MKNNPLYAEYALFLVAFFWGSNPPVMKWSLQHIDPMAFNAIRMIIACILSGALVYLLKPARPVDREDWPQLFKLGAFGFFIFQVFFTLGVTRTTAGNASLILGMLPVTVAIINMATGMEQVTRRIVASVAVTMAGVCLIVIGSGRELSLAGSHITGAAFLLCAQFAYGYYTVYSRRLTAKYSPFQINAFVFAVTTVLFILVALPSLIATDWSSVQSPAWIGAAYSGVFALSAGNFLWVWGVGIVGSAKASLFNNLAPVFAILLGYLILDEAFSLIQALGAAIIYAGLHIGRRQEAAAPDNKSATKGGEPDSEGSA